MKYISVFCGSSSGNEEIFIKQAELLGEIIARRGYGVVYGGARVGLMGAVAKGALKEGGEVIGIIPEFLKEKELEYKDISRMHVVDTMHERKAMMNDLSDGVVALPGGFGTMDELFEILTWAQLGLHKNPVGLLNLERYYDPLVEMTAKMIEKGFLKEEYRRLLIVEDNIEKLLDKMEIFVPLSENKWFDVR